MGYCIFILLMLHLYQAQSVSSEYCKSMNIFLGRFPMEKSKYGQLDFQEFHEMALLLVMFKDILVVGSKEFNRVCVLGIFNSGRYY